MPVIDNIWLTPEGVSGPKTLLGPGSSIRIVTNDFMFTGGDGYTAFTGGTDVLRTGDLLLDVAIEYVKTHSPVTAADRGAADRPVGRYGRVVARQLRHGPPART